MKKNIIRIVALVIACLMLAGVFSSILMFASNVNLKEGVYAYGSGLSNSQIEETRALLKADKKVQKIEIKGADSLKYIKEDNTDSEMISSIYAKENNRNETTVEVMTPLMIKNVTSVQYSNAAITAGLNNVDIKVASIVPVTGTSALTGVYKLMEAAGKKVDTERTVIANKEIELVNKIAENNKENKKFSKEKLNETVIKIKQKLVEEKEKKGKVNSDNITTIIQNVVKDNNLSQVLKKNDIKNLQIIFENFINIENIDLNLTKKQLESLSKNIGEIAKKEMDKIKDFINTDQGKQFLESLKGSLSKENLQNLLDNTKNALDSPEVENALNNVKNSINSENVNNLINGAKEGLENLNSNAGGFFENIFSFFGNIFNGIGNFFKNLFN